MLGETNGEKNSIVMQIMENQGVDISQVHARINEIVSETVEVEVDISQNDTNTPQNVEVEVDISQNDTNTPQNVEVEVDISQNDTNTPQNVEVEVDISQNDTNTPQNNDTNDSKSKIPKNPYSPSPRQILITRLILLLVVVMLIGYWFYGWWNRPKTINLTTFLQLVKAEEVAHIEVKDNLVTATKDNGEKVKTYIEPNMGIYQQLKSADIEVDNSQVSIQVRPSGTFRSLLLNVIQWVIIIVLVIILAVPLYRLYFCLIKKKIT
nr:ATP-dependent metallopeptidase FtsH/Yme1/Tma family protein [Okeania sp. KiyG1]